MSEHFLNLYNKTAVHIVFTIVLDKACVFSRYNLQTMSPLHLLTNTSYKWRVEMGTLEFVGVYATETKTNISFTVYLLFPQ